MIFVKKYQNHNDKLSSNGKWYLRPIVTDNCEIDEIAALIEEKCTVHRADILAVLTAMTTVLSREIQNSRRVVLPGIGAFKAGISCKGEEKEEDLTAENIERVRVIFQPEVVKQGNKYVKKMVAGARFKGYETLVPKEDDQTEP